MVATLFTVSKRFLLEVIASLPAPTSCIGVKAVLSVSYKDTVFWQHLARLQLRLAERLRQLYGGLQRASSGFGG